MLRTTLAGLKARFSRLVLSSVAIVLGVAFVTGTLILGDALQQNLSDTFARDARGVDAAVTAGYVEGAASQPILDQKAVATIAGAPGVASADLRESVLAAMSTANGHASQVSLTRLAADPVLRPNDITEGAYPASAGQIAVQKNTAAAHNLSVGGQVTLLDTQQRPVRFTVSGLYNDGASTSYGGDEMIVLPPAAAQFDTGVASSSGTVVVAAKPGVSQQSLVDSVQSALGKTGLEVQSGAAYQADQLRYIGGGDFFTTGMLIFAMIALVVAAMVIYNTFTILIAQRTRELALLRCVGADRKQVFRGVLIEAAVMGFVASVIGLVLGIGLSVVLQAFIATGPILVPVGVSTVLTAFAVGVLVTVAAAWLPARKATKVSPIEALRVQQDSHEEVKRTGRTRIIAVVVLGLLGAALTALGLSSDDRETAMFVVATASLVFLCAVVALGPLIVGPVNAVLGAVPRKLFGVPAKLAAGNANRNPKRTAATMAALMLGVAVVTMVTVVASSAKDQQDKELTQRFPADFSVSSVVSSQSVPQAVADQIAARPEVGVSGGVDDGALKFRTSSSTRGYFEEVQAISPGMLGSLVKLDAVTGEVSTLGPDRVIVSDRTAKEFGVAVGDQITAAALDRGTQAEGPRRDLTVSGIFKAPTGGRAEFYMSTQTYAAFSPKTIGYDEVQVKLKDGVSVSAGRTAVEQATASMPTAHITAAIDQKNDLDASVDTVLALVWAMIGLALVIALFGIANTLTLSVLERTRETALLRALGFTKGQLRQMLVIESFLMALMGAVIGVVLGGVCAALLLASISSDDFQLSVVIPYWQLVVLLIAAGLAAMLAAAAPSRRAAKSSIVAGMAEA